MIALRLTLISLIISTNAVSIGTVSEQNVTKREANVGDLFPDWVPFKNKHGEELGEFVQVTKKPKKRLAPPVNFILRAVAEPEGDDYYDKGQGESDSDDYYEKKEWSDTNRPSHPSDSPRSENHTEISEIDGVVNIITKTRPANPIVEALKKAKNRQDNYENKDKEEKKPPEDDKDDKNEKAAAAKKRHDADNKYEDDADYEESNAEKLKPEPIDEDQSENEAKKAIILDSVDELKARHAKEQVAISEKAKEEEIYREEREREKIQAQLSIDESDKYDDKPKAKKSFMDYEEYENKEASLEEKYNISPERTTKTPAPTTRQPKRTSKRKGKKDKTVESGKLSVFKNPQLYIVYDEIETTTIRPRVRPPVPSRIREDKFSAKYTSTPSVLDDAERISLVPEEEGKEGEPTLFFPKKRKGTKKRKSKITTASDSEETTYSDLKPKFTVPLTDTTGSDTIVVDTTADTAPSAEGSTYTDTVTDAVPASTDQKEEKKDEDYHREKGE